MLIKYFINDGLYVAYCVCASTCDIIIQFNREKAKELLAAEEARRAKSQAEQGPSLSDIRASKQGCQGCKLLVLSTVVMNCIISSLFSYFPYMGIYDCAWLNHDDTRSTIIV